MPASYSGTTRPLANLSCTPQRAPHARAAAGPRATAAGGGREPDEPQNWPAFHQRDGGHTKGGSAIGGRHGGPFRAAGRAEALVACRGEGRKLMAVGAERGCALQVPTQCWVISFCWFRSRGSVVHGALSPFIQKDAFVDVPSCIHVHVAPLWRLRHYAAGGLLPPFSDIWHCIIASYT